MPASCASVAAGSRLLIAVPEVTQTAAGMPVAFAIPRARNDAERSSTADQQVMRGSASSARRIGAFLEPGQSTA